MVISAFILGLVAIAGSIAFEPDNVKYFAVYFGCVIVRRFFTIAHAWSQSDGADFLLDVAPHRIVAPGALLRAVRVFGQDSLF